MKLLPNWDATKTQAFRTSLLCWYGAHHRALPWRSKPAAYQVWISEIMLQQTQVKTVIPYYHRFIKRFPNLESLAKAPLREVLELWAGLGYYSRARNLHRAAKLMAKKHGSFPEEFSAVLALPGVGRYTAGAICSIAFNQAQPIVDGNARRVLTRLDGIRERIPDSYFWNRMSTLLPEGNASCFNQAMMELGALVCVPSKPDCVRCPVESFCAARKLGIQDSIPGIRKGKAPKHLRIVALVLQRDRRILLSSLGKHNFIPGKWGLPCQVVATRKSERAVAASLCRQILGYAVSMKPCPRVRHSISRYRLLVSGFYGKVGSQVPQLEKCSSYRWGRFSSNKTPLMSSLFRKVMEKCEELRMP